MDDNKENEDVNVASSSKMKTNEQRQTRWETEEIYLLANFVGRHNTVLFGTAKGAGVQARKNKSWGELERIMKAAGYSRPWDACRRKWIDVSHRAKTYDHHRKGAKVTGGGPQPPENPVFEAVLKALPDVVVEGILPAGVCDTVPKVNMNPVPVVPAKEMPAAEDIPGTSADLYLVENSQSSLSDTDTEREKVARSQKRKAPKTCRSVKKQKTSSGDEFVEINKKMVEVEAEKLEVQKQILEELKGIKGVLSLLITTSGVFPSVSLCPEL